MNTPEQYEQEFKQAQSDYEWAVKGAEHFRRVRRNHYIKVACVTILVLFLMLTIARIPGLSFLVVVGYLGWLFYEINNYRVTSGPDKILKADQDVIHEKSMMDLKEEDWIKSIIEHG